jgi:hypothetical protein
LKGGLMTTPSRDKVTQLLLDWGKGDEAALQQLVPLVHKELHRLAHRYMARERRHVTLQSTVLVNEPQRCIKHGWKTVLRREHR